MYMYDIQQTLMHQKNRYLSGDVYEVEYENRSGCMQLFLYFLNKQDSLELQAGQCVAHFLNLAQVCAGPTLCVEWENVRSNADYLN